MLNELEWKSFKDRRTVNRLTTLYNARMGLLAQPVDNLLQPIINPSGQHQHQSQ